MSGWEVASGKPANFASPAKDTTALADLANSQAGPIPPRDSNGRFLTGNSGGGRPKGSKNKLTESVLSIVASDFQQNGASVLAKLRADDPATYLRFISALLPKELIVEREKSPLPYIGEVTVEELIELIDDARRRQFALIAVQHVIKR